MNWIQIDSEEIINEIKEKSREKRVFVFVFSDKVVTSIIVRNLLEREWSEGEMNMDTYFLDVPERPETAKLAFEAFGVEQYVPQGLIIEKEKCIYSVTDGNLRFDLLRDFSNPRKKKIMNHAQQT